MEWTRHKKIRYVKFNLGVLVILKGPQGRLLNLKHMKFIEIQKQNPKNLSSQCVWLGATVLATQQYLLVP